MVRLNNYYDPFNFSRGTPRCLAGIAPRAGSRRMRKDQIRVQLLREAGGLGDVVRCTTVARGFKEKYPGCEVWFFVLRGYEEICAACPHIDHVVSVDLAERRGRDRPIDENRWPYLRIGGPYDFRVDLFCPAYQHEVKTRGAVTKERTEIWCEAAGVRPKLLTPELVLSPQVRGWAEGFLDQSSLRNRKVIICHPFGTSRIRNWPERNWIALTEKLLAAGYGVVHADGCKGRIRRFPGVLFREFSLSKLAALLHRASMVVGGDSGLFHLAGAVGTPALGLFGCTSGEIMRRPYPLAQIIQGPPDFPGKPEKCLYPCYYRRERGVSPECRKNGCASLNQVSPEQVFKRIRMMMGDEK